MRKFGNFPFNVWRLHAGGRSPTALRASEAHTQVPALTQVRPGQIIGWPTPNSWTAESRCSTVCTEGSVSCVYTRRASRSRSFFSDRTRLSCWRITRSPWERCRWPRAAANELQALVRRCLPFWCHGDIIATSAIAIRGIHFSAIQKQKIKTAKREHSPRSPRLHT